MADPSKATVRITLLGLGLPVSLMDNNTKYYYVLFNFNLGIYYTPACVYPLLSHTWVSVKRIKESC